MRVKRINKCHLILVVAFIIGIIMISLSLQSNELKSANAFQTKSSQFEQKVQIDILDGSKKDNTDAEVSLVQNNKSGDIVAFGHCNEIFKKCGPGLENGYYNYTKGCRNWEPLGNIMYGYRDIPFWIDKKSFNTISNKTHRELIYSDIRKQAQIWNSVYMDDGIIEGPLINFYEVGKDSDICPLQINGVDVVRFMRMTQEMMTKYPTAVGLYSPSNIIYIKYDENNKGLRPGWNIDTPLHELGHLLGLSDLDASNRVDYGTHKVLMGYNRGTNESNLKYAIKYQDIQGVALLNNLHTRHSFGRYIQKDGQFLKICFYCDAVKVLEKEPEPDFIMLSRDGCGIPKYHHIFSVGNKQWIRCINCYEVVENEFYTRDVQINGVNGVEIIGQKNTKTSYAVIPAFINGKPVISIGSFAYANQSWLSEIDIPYTILSIEANAFSHALSLKKVHFKNWRNSKLNQLQTIGNAAFYNCINLSSINISENVETIGYNAFENCTNLSLLTFEENSKLSVINNSAFAGCSSLLAIMLPASLKNIGVLAFKDCSKAVSLRILNGESKLTDIGNSAFDGCTSLSLVNLPNSLKRVGAYAFYSCSTMNSLVLYNAVTTIGANAFANCDLLTIYTTCTNAGSGWVSGWNSSNRPVVYGCDVSTDRYCVVSFTKSATNPTNRNAENGIKNPYSNSININFGGWYTTADFSGTKYDDIISAPNGKLYVNWVENTCVAEGSLITLADGTQKAVEDLTGDEQLLVWNMFTGTFDTAPILFIDSESRQEYEVIKLSFSDGTTVKVISEHAFWDFDLNKYVFLRADAARYIGHWFNKQTVNADGEKEWSKVQLVDVELTREITAAYSPVTYGHLCYYVNGMLSMPGATEGLINIFDVDGDTMKIDEDAFNKDIEKYGLFTYEEFAELLPISEEVFDAFGGQYLKVAIGKGLIDIDKLAELIARYAEFF